MYTGDEYYVCHIVNGGNRFALVEIMLVDSGRMLSVGGVGHVSKCIYSSFRTVRRYVKYFAVQFGMHQSCKPSLSPTVIVMEAISCDFMIG